MFQKEKNVLVHLFLRNPVLLVLLCDTVAQGIIQPLTGVDQSEPGLPADEGKKQVKKEGAVLKALQVCQLQKKMCKCLYILSLLIKKVVKHLRKTILGPLGCGKKMCESCD